MSLAWLSPLSVRAAPPEQPPADAREAPTHDAPEVPNDEAAIRSALQDGDLTTARDMAVAQSKADPSVDNHLLEAEVWMALGDYQHAKRAYMAARDALPEDAADQREFIDGELATIEAVSRGTKADEPESTERERLDAERAERIAALAPKLEPPPIADQPKPVPIIKKWYFWVTLGAIAASAGAIVGIAVSSAVEERHSGMATAGRQVIPAGGLMLRF